MTYVNYFGGPTFIQNKNLFEIKYTTLPPKYNLNAAAGKPVSLLAINLQSLATADFSLTMTYNGN